MEVSIVDRTLMMVFLLEECNLSCVHCVREEEPMEPGYRLASDQLRRCLADCRSLPSIEWVHFSGGEPTLWREGERDLSDLLLMIADAGYDPGFTTNGLTMTDPGFCSRLLGGYLDGADRTLRLYLSVDTFHGNLDMSTGRSAALDTVLGFREALPGEAARLLDVKVLTVVSRDEASLLPEGMVERYSKMGAQFVYVPLKPVGRARAMSHLCPDLEGGMPEDLGAYGRFFDGRARKAGGGASNIVLIGEDYYLPDPWRRVAALGRLPAPLLDAYR